MCSEETKSGINEILNIQKDAFEEKYLGLPTPEGRMNKGKFDSLQAELSKRILQWNDLSQGSKEIMIKAVGQALPTYVIGFLSCPCMCVMTLQN
jgi:hypothetical protein